MIRIELAPTSPEQWRDRACRFTDPELFFARRNSAKAAQAKALCQGCRRLHDCAEWARWAGLTDCVVASVRMADAGQSRTAEMAELDEIISAGTALIAVGEAAA